MFAVFPMNAAARKVDREQRLERRHHKRRPNLTVGVAPDTMVARARMDIAAIPLFNPARSGQSNINGHCMEGIDVSHYQGMIDWNEVARSGSISYVYIKASEGESMNDDCYRRNLLGARRVGISVGSYHFYRPNVPPEVQFQNMISVVHKEEQDLVPLIDIEVSGRHHVKFIRDLKRFISLVERHYGKRPLLYTYHNFYNKHLVGKFKRHHWMIARYKTDQPWLNDGNKFIMWQYTQRGTLPGIEGYVDRSQIMKGRRLEELKL